MGSPGCMLHDPYKLTYSGKSMGSKEHTQQGEEPVWGSTAQQGDTESSILQPACARRPPPPPSRSPRGGTLRAVGIGEGRGAADGGGSQRFFPPFPIKWGVWEVAGGCSWPGRLHPAPKCEGEHGPPCPPLPCPPFGSLPAGKVALQPCLSFPVFNPANCRARVRIRVKDRLLGFSAPQQE